MHEQLPQELQQSQQLPDIITDSSRATSPPPPRDFPSGMLPHTATPTIALSDNSFALGTTIKGEHNALKSHLDQAQQPPQSNLTAQLQTKQLPEATTSDLLPSSSTRNNSKNSNSTVHSNSTLQGSGNASVDAINNASNISRSAGNSIASDSDTNQSPVPRGKLRINLIEATDLNVTSGDSQPYVVCTFEGSEVVTSGPERFGSHHKSQHHQFQGAEMMTSIDGQLESHNQPIRPVVSRQTSSHQSLNIRNNNNNCENRDSSSLDRNYNAGNPIWQHSSIFDVIGNASDVEISIYDGAQDDFFLGHVRIRPRTDSENKTEGWYTLRPRISSEMVTGTVRIKFEYTNIGKSHYSPQDFKILRLLGKGTFGQVFQVKKKDTNRVYAMKVLSKKVIVKKKEVAHTIGERDIMVRTSAADSAFIVMLKFSFQTPTDLYLVTDFMSGGELFWHLQREGRFSEDRAKFYIAELVMALEHLHDNGIVYRDLKPENILLDANGHIALCDFGLSKANLSGNGTTNTFCGTTEYLAPEVLLDESGYTKMVDFWSLGVLIFEMCCGWSPFYAENTQQMYKNIAFGKVRFPKEVLSPEGRSFVKGLLNRNPKHRLGAIDDARELRAHPFLHDIEWHLLRERKIPPPFVPHIVNELDTSNFDPEFTNASTSAINRQLMLGSTPLSQAMQDKFKGFTYVDDSTMFDHLSSLSVKKGNSLKPQYGSLIPGDPNMPPDEEVIEDDTDFDEDDEGESRNEDEDMDVDDEFVNGPFDL
ncbi:Serine/threonine-protein kinase [Brettanomyces nanus]|uniref:Serine/threonine-protein kinase SCH9 n=1 Tax=Eeniella nana TaxID=13502 RepID=A0A875S180_EENNA|nr:Serine/threonine-protein kinase [Brettanomyces nanus]QPG73609.1 Serine/threonine-protein kinase [Brettanomyces nanus]